MIWNRGMYLFEKSMRRFVSKEMHWEVCVSMSIMSSCVSDGATDSGDDGTDDNTIGDSSTLCWDSELSSDVSLNADWTKLTEFMLDGEDGEYGGSSNALLHSSSSSRSKSNSSEPYGSSSSKSKSPMRSGVLISSKQALIMWMMELSIIRGSRPAFGQLNNRGKF